MPKRCRKCAGCGNARRGKLIARIMEGVRADEKPAFLTLTSTPGTEWKAIMRAWSSMVRELRRVSPELQYVAVKEQGSGSGMKHLHVILLNFRYTPHSSISAAWARLTGAWVVNIQRTSGAKTAVYVAKYCAKGTAFARKNATFSKDWPKLPPTTQECQSIDSTGPWGPTSWIGVTPRYGLIALLAPGCTCWGKMEATTLEVHLWLASLQGHSPPESAGNWVP